MSQNAFYCQSCLLGCGAVRFIFSKKALSLEKASFFAKPAKNEGHISKNLQQSNFPYFGKRNSKLQFSIKNGLTETLIENYFLNEI